MNVECFIRADWLTLNNSLLFFLFPFWPSLFIGTKFLICFFKTLYLMNQNGSPLISVLSCSFLLLRCSSLWNRGIWGSSGSFSFLLSCYQLSRQSAWPATLTFLRFTLPFPFPRVEGRCVSLAPDTNDTKPETRPVSPGLGVLGPLQITRTCLLSQVIQGGQTHHPSERTGAARERRGISPWALLTCFDFSTGRFVLFSRSAQNLLI